MVMSNKSACLPFFTQFIRTVVKKVRFPSEVLPVVRVNAQSLVVFLVEWAPLSLKVEHVELAVTGHFVD